MIKKIISRPQVIIISFLFFLCNLYGQTRLIHHTPPPYGVIGQELKLVALSFEVIEPIDATLYYRLPGSKSFLEIPFKNSGINWEASLPGFSLTAEGLEYIIAFQFSRDRLVSFPREDPFNNPYYLTTVPPKGQKKIGMFNNLYSEDILILSPEPNELVNQESVLIATSFFNTDKVDFSTVQLFLDDLEVTNSVLIEEGILTYDPGILTIGIHSIQILMKDIDGESIIPLKWDFIVGTERIEILDLVTYNGRLNSRLSSEKLGRTSLNIAEVIGDFSVDVQWAKLNTDLRLTSRESPYSQPNNRLGTAFSIGGFLDVNMGDFYPQLSRFTIDGKRVRGLGIDADLKWLKVQFINGELNRAVQEKAGVNGGYNILYDLTTPNEDGSKTYYLDRTGFSFKRKITGLRLSTDLFSKLNMGVHLVKTRDDTTSVNRILDNAKFYSDTLVQNIPVSNYTLEEFKNALLLSGDTLLAPNSHWKGQKPKDNLILGFNIGTVLDNQKLTLDFDWNMSLYNRNIWDGVMSISELDTAIDDSLDGYIGLTYDGDGKEISGSTKIKTSDILIDPENIQSLFIMNTNMTPLVPIDLTALSSNPISSIINMPSSAFKIKLRGNYSRNSLLVEYQQIGPEYVSLGNPFLRNNTRQFTISDRISLLDQKLFLNIGFKHLDNKILKTTVSPLNTNTLFMNLTFLLGLNMPTFVFNYQSIGKNNEKTSLDSVGSKTIDFREDSKAANTMFSVSIPFTSGSLKQNFTLNTVNINNLDNLIKKRSESYLFPKTDSKTISMTLSSLFPSQLKTVALISQTRLDIPSRLGNQLIKIPYIWTHLSLSANKQILEEKIKAKGSLSFLNSKSQINSKVLGLRAGFDFRIQENLTASITSQVRFNYRPSFNKDKLDNDGDGQIDNSGEVFDMNSLGIILNIQYNF